MAELADALDLGSSAIGVKVQILSPAPIQFLCGSGSVVERRLAKANVASSNLVFRSKWRHSQVVRQGPAKPLPPVQIWVAPPCRRKLRNLDPILIRMGFLIASISLPLPRKGTPFGLPPLRGARFASGTDIPRSHSDGGLVLWRCCLFSAKKHGCHIITGIF